MPPHHKTREDDMRLLNILDMKIKGQVHPVDLRKKFGLTNSALSGIMNRYRQSEEPCACVRPENKDGGMQDRWWDQ